ncbi:hypothetical protein [Roseinatronobacter monicus]|nr:hypothetical protein [Roseinatronobacter monicus]
MGNMEPMPKPGIYFEWLWRKRSPLMETLPLIAVLSLFTLACVIVFAWVSKRKVEQRRHDDQIPKSSLATDSRGKGAVEALDDK